MQYKCAVEPPCNALIICFGGPASLSPLRKAIKLDQMCCHHPNKTLKQPCMHGQSAWSHQKSMRLLAAHGETCQKEASCIVSAQFQHEAIHAHFSGIPDAAMRKKGKKKRKGVPGALCWPCSFWPHIHGSTPLFQPLLLRASATDVCSTQIRDNAKHTWQNAVHDLCWIGPHREQPSLSGDEFFGLT